MLPLQNTPESRNRTGITALFEFYLKDNKAGVGIASAHIGYERKFLGSVLVGMTVERR